MAADPPRGPDPGAFDLRAVRRHFARAATTYDAAAVLQKVIGARLVEKLDAVKLTPAAVLDAGCGTGDAQAEFAARYPSARYVGLDVAQPMLAVARSKGRLRRSALARILATFAGGRAANEPRFVCGDIAAMPFAAATFELVWSNLALQWVGDLSAALAEMNRVLAVDGLATFTTFGPDTLKEVRAAFSEVDGNVHVSRFIDMHDIGDMLVAAGFADPVMEMEMLSLTYDDAEAMLRDLKAIGATNAAAARPRALMGRRRWARALAALDATRREGRIAATFEVIYGHAWKVPPQRTRAGDAIVRFRPRGRA
ncbi:MAG TPA: malonyl-ACP O-methyltransferase BioC [Casimicrobiaceae bacterium]|nr:malonyl-ACP O-methyltransferase BioC [Casimicrobiaceae bacterium]